MNEYDSAKMADVLAASDGLELTDERRGSRRHPGQHLLDPREGAGKGLQPARPLEGAQAGRQAGGDRRRRLRGLAGRRGDRQARAVRRPGVRPADAAPPARADPGQRRETGQPQVDISFPEIEKFDRLPEPRAEGPSAFVSIMEGCSKYCSFCVVPYTRGEEVSRPFEDVLVEVAAPRGAGRARGQPARPERQRLSRPVAPRRGRGESPTSAC